MAFICSAISAPSQPPARCWLIVRNIRVKSLSSSHREVQATQSFTQAQCLRSPVGTVQTSFSMDITSVFPMGVSVEITFRGKSQTLLASKKEDGFFVFSTPAYFTLDRADTTTSFRISVIVREEGYDDLKAEFKFKPEGETLEQPLRREAVTTVIAKEGKLVDIALIPEGADSVVKAWYGRDEALWGAAGIDVTEKVRELLRSDQPLKASNENFGDPYPRRSKALAIQVKAVTTVIAKEGKSIAKALIPEGADSVVKAWYGREKAWGAGIDVTEKVKELLRYDQPLNANNANFGDPFPQRSKALAIQVKASADVNEKVDELSTLQSDEIEALKSEYGSAFSNSGYQAEAWIADQKLGRKYLEQLKWAAGTNEDKYCASLLLLKKAMMKSKAPVIEVYCKVENLTDALQIVRESSEFALPKVLGAIKDILNGPIGLNLLINAIEKVLKPRDPAAAKNRLDVLLPELLCCMPRLESDLSDEETIKVFKNISRGVLKFMEDHRSKTNKDVVDLAVSCFREFFARYANVKRRALKFNETSFRRLLCAAQVEIRNLEPAHKKTGIAVVFKDKYGRPMERRPCEEKMWEGIKTFSKPQKHEARLAAGAYGHVWRAIDSHTGKTYAVKNVLPNPDGDREHEERMAEHEIALLRRIMEQDPHPCIVDFYNVESHTEPGQTSESAELPWAQRRGKTIFVHIMEFCSGGNLLDRIVASRSENGKYVIPQLAMKWIGEIFLGLEYMHLILDMLHRDLKPENIVLDEHGVAKLTDFGRSMLGNQGSNHTFGFAPGNFYYTAPEVYLELPYDSKADLYSFGALTWFVLTGGIGYPDAARNGKLVYLVPMKGDHRQNCIAMQECLEDHTKYNALDLPCQDSKNLVKSLTQRSQEERPIHADIRDHPFMQNLGLPPLNSSVDEVVSWINGEDVLCSRSRSDSSEEAPYHGTNVRTIDIQRVQHEWKAHQDWLASIYNERRMKTQSIKVCSVDKMGVDVVSAMLKVNISISGKYAHGSFYGVGGSVAILVALHHDGNTSTIVVRQPRVAVCSTTVAEIPSGRFDIDGNFIGDGVSAICIEEVLWKKAGLRINQRDIIDMTELSTRGQYPGMYPSSDTSDACNRICLYRKEITSKEYDDLNVRLKDNLGNSDMSALEILPLDELWRKSPDAKALAATCLYKKLRVKEHCPSSTPNDITKAIKDTQVSFEGAWTGGCINGRKLQWKNGSRMTIDILTPKQFTVYLQKTVFVATLKADDQLHWSDGNIWQRMEATPIDA